MESDSTIPGLVWAISLAFFFLVSLVEASLFTLRRERVRAFVADGKAGSEALERLFSVPSGPASALPLLRVLLGSSSLLSGAALAIAWSGTNWAMIALVSLAVLALLGFAHIVAKVLASAYGEPVALRTAILVWGLSRALTPVLAVGSWAMRRARSVNGDQADSLLDPVPGQVRISLDTDGEPLDEREARMIRGVVGLDRTTAREIMVPRGDMVVAELSTPLDQLASQMVGSGHSRVPTYKDDLDHIEGIAYAKDILAHLSQGNESAKALTASLLRPALFIPESKTLEELLSEFQDEQVHIAIVIDEYGGVSGLVTIEDLLEEIVGEIEDEFDAGDPVVERIGDDEFMMDARVSIDQLGELLRVAVEGDGFDTVGGFVYQRLGKIPSSGDAVEYDGLKIEVVSTLGRRLKKLRVTRTAAGPDPAGAEQ